MKKTFTLLMVMATVGLLKAQNTAPAYGADQYGVIEKADLEMTLCDFEKDAKAEVLFDREIMYFDHIERHIRIKIFDDVAKEFGNISINYLGGAGAYLTNIQAETFNLVDGKIQTTKLDDKQLYKEKLDKWRYKMVFAMPDVKAGSVIEYSYNLYNGRFYFPRWFYQNVIPERYNELNVESTDLDLIPNPHVSQPFAKKGIVYDILPNHKFVQTAMTNVPSLSKEPYMTSLTDNLQSMSYNLTGVSYIHIDFTWKKIAKFLAENEDFGMQINTKLLNEDSVITKAKKMKSVDDKVSYTFNTVRDAMKWNGSDTWFTNDGTYTAWKNKAGNSSEINLVLCHLLKREGVNASPMLVSTRENGKVNPAYINTDQFNRTVVYVPNQVDTSLFYVLDAANRYNSYNQMPPALLNSVGLSIDINNENGKLVGIEDDDPVRKIVLIDAGIDPDGKLTGTADISDFGYNRNKTIEQYKTLDDKKFLEYLTSNNNGIAISNLKFDNMDVDTLPLTTNFSFTADLQGSDQGYIYLNTNFFTSLNSNPFLGDKRATDIDFGYRDNYSISCTYKIPAGYKVDVLPKNINTIMPDGSLSFKRFIVEQDGIISVRYSIDHKKTFYFKEGYADFHEFYKKMYEMLNEQIVLKKS